MIRTSFNFTVSAGDNIIEQCQRAYPDAGDNLRIHNVVVTSAQLAISTHPLEHCISVVVPADGSVFERVVLGHGTPGTAAENTFQPYWHLVDVVLEFPGLAVYHLKNLANSFIKFPFRLKMPLL